MKFNYMNGNTLISISDTDGTREMFTRDDEFDLDFPVSMDISIGKRCDGGCAFCYDGATPDGKEGDLLNARFIDSLHPYTEVAINGNSVNHSQLIPFLKKLKSMNVFANMTVNQIHFERKEDLISDLINKKLIYGLGVSLRNPTNEFLDRVTKYPNAVIHVINGIATETDFEKMANRGLKVLILGYKDKGRGHDYLAEYPDEVRRNQQWLYDNIGELIYSDKYRAVAFDNLALEQLDLQRVIPDDQWQRFYQGDEGTSSMFVDLVDGTFGVSSLVPKSEMMPIMDTVEEMFSVVKNRRNA